jgi:hypothetical protein
VPKMSAPHPVTVNMPLVKLAQPGNPTAPMSRVSQGEGTLTVGVALASAELYLPPSSVPQIWFNARLLLSVIVLPHWRCVTSHIVGDGPFDFVTGGAAEAVHRNTARSVRFTKPPGVGGTKRSLAVVPPVDIEQ